MYVALHLLLVLFSSDSVIHRSSSISLIPSSAVVKRQAGQGGNTAHTAPNVLSTFQKHYLPGLLISS